MGNRAVITASKSKDSGLGIYLHWNGGIESVVAFLDVASQLRYRSPEEDESYGMAKLCGLISLYCGIRSETGVGINDLSKLDCDNYDNGVYVVGEGWQIVDRWGHGSRPFKRTDIADARSTHDYMNTVDAMINTLQNADPNS